MHVYNGPTRTACPATCNGKLFIEMSTVPPKVEIALAPKVVRARARRFVECPVGGSTGAGAAGQAARA